MRGIAIWSAVLIYSFWRVPKVLPHSIKLASTAVMCGLVTLLATVYRLSRGVPYWSPDEDSRLTIVGLLGGASVSGALVCGAIAFILDAKQRPSSPERVIVKR
jgi:hypothetical protein